MILQQLAAMLPKVLHNLHPSLDSDFPLVLNTHSCMQYVDDFRQHKNAVVEFNYRGVMYVDKSEDIYQCTDGDGTVVLTYNENTTRLLKPYPVERL